MISYLVYTSYYLLLYKINYCTSDVSYLTADQTIYVMENSTTKILPGLPCSISGSTSISFSAAKYMASTVPSWVIIDSGSGVLRINAPEVSLNTEYDFYINSAVSGVSSPIQKLIKLIITNCTAKNWKKCISTNSSTCETCLSGYILSSGVWDIPTVSETARVLSRLTMFVVIAITWIVVLTNIMNTTSIVNLWTTINQLQLFIFVILSKIYFNNFFRILIINFNFNWLILRLIKFISILLIKLKQKNK